MFSILKITAKTTVSLSFVKTINVAEWLARRTRDLVVAGSIPNQAMLQLPWESNLP